MELGIGIKEGEFWYTKHSTAIGVLKRLGLGIHSGAARLASIFSVYYDLGKGRVRSLFSCTGLYG